MTRFQHLLFWMQERERIRLLKEDGVPPPWTKDPILATYRFCNVHREDDKVTRWLKANWRDPYAKHMNLTGAMVLARMLNRIETLEAIGFPNNFSHCFANLRDYRNTGAKIFSAAYLITTCGVKMDKLDYVERVVTQAAKTIPCIGDSLETYHHRLMMVNGLGTFLAAQVIADLKNIKGNPLAAAKDKKTWAAMGPGSRRGLMALLEEEGGRYRERDALEQMSRFHDKAMNSVEISLFPQDLDMQDFQNCLCEFDKYLRTLEGRGKPKQLYSGGA